MRAPRLFLAALVSAVLVWFSAPLPARATYLPSNAASYVAGFTPSSPGLTANLLANAACSAAYVGQYAVVSDLYGSTNEVLRCGYTSGFATNGGYYWRPQRTDYVASLAMTSTAATLTPLANAPLIVLTGTLTGNTTVTPSATNAWPGACFEITNGATLGVYTMTLVGLVGGNQILAALTTKTLCYTGSGYQAF